MADNYNCWVCYNCVAWTRKRPGDNHKYFCPDCGTLLLPGVINPYTGDPYGLDKPINTSPTHYYYKSGIVLTVIGVIGVLAGLSSTNGNNFAFISFILIIIGVVFAVKYRRKPLTTEQTKIKYLILPELPVSQTINSETPKLNVNEQTATSKYKLPCVIPAKSGDFIRKYQYKKVKIIGVNNLEDKSIITEDLYRKRVLFTYEPDNEYDSEAISVICDDYKLGYMARESNLRKMIFDFDKRGDEVVARVDSVITDVPEITILLAFYVHANKMECRECKLSGNRDEESQDNIALFDTDDEAEIHYDYEKDRYVAGILGYLSPKDSQFVANLDDGKYISVVSRKELDDNDKYLIWVNIYY